MSRRPLRTFSHCELEDGEGMPGGERLRGEGGGKLGGGDTRRGAAQRGSSPEGEQPRGAASLGEGGAAQRDDKLIDYLAPSPSLPPAHPLLRASSCLLCAGAAVSSCAMRSPAHPECLPTFPLPSAQPPPPPLSTIPHM